MGASSCSAGISAKAIKSSGGTTLRPVSPDANRSEEGKSKKVKVKSEYLSSLLPFTFLLLPLSCVPFRTQTQSLVYFLVDGLK
jgi:hypothetical protein